MIEEIGPKRPICISGRRGWPGRLHRNLRSPGARLRPRRAAHPQSPEGGHCRPRRYRLDHRPRTGLSRREKLPAHRPANPGRDQPQPGCRFEGRGCRQGKGRDRQAPDTRKSIPLLWSKPTTPRMGVLDATCGQKLRTVDFIFACTDSHASRAIVCKLCYQFLIPGIDVEPPSTRGQRRSKCDHGAHADDGPGIAVLALHGLHQLRCDPQRVDVAGAKGGRSLFFR